MNGARTSGMLRVMPREMRLMSERILSLTDLPRGFSLMAQDVVMFSEAMGLGGFAALAENFETLRHADVSKIAVIREDGDGLIVDGGGQHAWFVVPSAVDLAGELVAAHGSGRVGVINVIAPEELQIAAGFAPRSGIAIKWRDGDMPELFAGTAQPHAGTGGYDPVLWRLMNDGCQIPADIWWRIYDLARTALAPDSVVSRRHAGPLIVADDGTVIGRQDNDEDTDLSFLIEPPARETRGKEA